MDKHSATWTPGGAYHAKQAAQSHREITQDILGRATQGSTQDPQIRDASPMWNCIEAVEQALSENVALIQILTAKLQPVLDYPGLEAETSNNQEKGANSPLNERLMGIHSTVLMQREALEYLLRRASL